MATVESLNVSISRMDFHEATQLVMASRKRRRTVTEKPKRVIARIENGIKTRKKQTVAIGKLSPAQAAALLQQLLGGT